MMGWYNIGCMIEEMKCFRRIYLIDAYITYLYVPTNYI